MKTSYSEAIIKLRAKLNISQSELAKMISSSLVSVNRWEKGVHDPTVIAKEKLKQLFSANGIDFKDEEKNGKVQ